MLAKARAALRTHAAFLPAGVTVAAAGSLGRLETGPDSDLDLLVIVDFASAADATLCTTVLEVLGDCGLEPPKADGIYRTPVGRDALLDERARGSLDETPDVFGKRMQCLLDARPLFNDAAFVALRRDLLRWYGEPFQRLDPAASWTLLINDLSRYLHAYAGWQQHKFARSADDSWLLRQMKLRSSRLVTFAGLLFLAGASNSRPDKQAWLAARLGLSPLERVGCVMRERDPAAGFRRRSAAERDPGTRDPA
ncbi:MAG: hypothetical protein ACU85V_13760, partial [Gammaproteobacteria bacterium]